MYLVASIGYSFFFMTLGTVLLGRGVPLGTIAVINLLGTVYFARFLVAPVVDRYGTHRRWIALTQLGLVATLVAISTVDPLTDLPVLLGLMTLVLMLSLFHDVALGGMAVRLLRPAEHGIANGVQVAAASASMLIGSGGALALYAAAGWRVTLLALAAVFVVPLAVLALLPRPSADGGGETRTAVPWRALAGSLRRPRAAVWTLVMIPVFAAGEWLASGPQPAMLLAVGWPMGRIATVQSISVTAQMVIAIAAGPPSPATAPAGPRWRSRRSGSPRSPVCYRLPWDTAPSCRRRPRWSSCRSSTGRNSP